MPAGKACYYPRQGNPPLTSTSEQEKLGVDRSTQSALLPWAGAGWAGEGSGEVAVDG